MTGAPFSDPTKWMHIFCSRIVQQEGDYPELHSGAIKIYLFIKAHINFDTSRSFPGVERIASGCGLSKSQVLRYLKILQEKQYVKITKTGRHNTYEFFEKFDFVAADSGNKRTMFWIYRPLDVKKVTNQIKSCIRNNNLAGLAAIQNHTINVHIGCHIGNNTNITLQKVSPTQHAERIAELRQSLTVKLEKL